MESLSTEWDAVHMGMGEEGCGKKRCWSLRQSLRGYVNRNMSTTEEVKLHFKTECAK